MSTCAWSATQLAVERGPPGITSAGWLPAADPSLRTTDPDRSIQWARDSSGASATPTGQDPGHTDQRLLVIEPEFAGVLRAASREISTLSPTLRSGWDGRPLAILTRTAPARASTAHITLIGRHTPRRAPPLHHQPRTRQRLPQPGAADRLPPTTAAARRRRSRPTASAGLDRLLAAALRQARTAGQVRLDPDARELWHHRLPRARDRTDRPDRRADHRPRRGTHHPTRATSTPSPTVNATSASRTSRPSLAPPELRHPIRSLGTDRRDRAAARRTDPRHPRQQPRRPDPQPNQRHAQTRPTRRRDRLRAPRSPDHRPSDRHPDQDRRPARPTRTAAPRDA